MSESSLLACDKISLDCCDFAAAFSPPCTTPPHLPEMALQEHTNSINRSYSHLDTTRFLLYGAGLCWLRTALQQPLNIALARQQTCDVSSSMTTAQIVRRIYKTEGGIRGLSQGMAAITLGCTLSEAIYLFLFEYGREAISVECDVTRDAASGYVADAVCRLVHLPLSIVALRQMTAKKTMTGGIHKTDNIFRTFLTLYRENGVRSIFSGYGTTLLIGCQWTGVWWAMYGHTKSWLYGATDMFLINEEPGLLEKSPASFLDLFKHYFLARDDNMLINSTASIFTSVTTAALFNPYLVVRANVQVTPKARFWPVTRDLYRTRGVRGFFGGLTLNIGTCLIDGVLASTSYEYAKLWSDLTQNS